MTNGFKTDARILLLLEGGSRFRNMIDPDHLIGEGQLTMIVEDRRTNAWKTKIVFRQGEIMLISGICDKEANYIITSIKIIGYQNENMEIACKPTRTILSGLESLEGIPARLKRLLAPVGPQNAKETNCSTAFKHYWEILDDALFWDTEQKGKNDPDEKFNIRKISFIYNEAGSPIKVEFSAICSLAEGRITMSANADVYGIGDKKVTLIKNLGMKRAAEIDCTLSKDDHKVASIKAAFDLYETIPILYEKQRKKKPGLGKPKAK